jgi:Leucine-rich repeat (LRR) protein
MKTKLLLFLLFVTIIINAQTNLVPNGNFENWTSSSQPDNWYRYFSGFVSKSTSAQNGTSSTNMKIADGTFNYINSEYFPVVANKTYRITLYHKLVSGSFSAIDLSLYHKPGTFKSEINKKTDATVSSTEWRKIELDYTPTVSENIEVDIWTIGTLNSEILVDNVSVIDVAAIGAQYTLIPDVNFEKKLIALGIDSGVTDGKVLTNSVNKLTSLDVSNSSIVDLTGIQDFVGLKNLNCNNNQLSILNVSKNVALTDLRCLSNVLTSLDVSTNLTLSHLDCDSNRLTALDLTANLALNLLDCRSNKLTTLNLSKNVGLGTLYCHNNLLTVLDVTKNVALTKLICNINPLITLDISKNIALTSFDCASNKLTSLNLKNGKNTLLTNINLSSNPDLRCIIVDDVTYSNTNWANKKDATAIYSPYDCSTITQIPDPKFEDKLIALGIDTDGKNGVVLNSSIAAITSLNVSNSAIVDLTGIQGFTALTTLNCSGNLLKKIDVSKNTAITTLNCANNPTLICIQVANVAAAANWATTKDATADFSLDCTIYTLIPDAKFEDKLIALGIDRDGKKGKVATESIASLTSLEVYGSSITDLTGIQDFKALSYLECSYNQLKTLDVSKNVALTTLNCFNNQLTVLDVSKNVALKSFICSTNQLTTLDISKNVVMNFLDCSSNQIATLDVSKNVALATLGCNSNQLSALDISKNVVLTSLYCQSNKLTSLNLKNGKNTLLTNSHINLSSNPDLSCIVVDDVAYSNTNWTTKKDSFAFFSPFDCSTITKIPDPKFEDKLIALGIDTDGKNGVVLNASIAAITSLNVSNSAIADLTGIQGFTALTTLNCSGNLVKKIDVSKNTAITTLNCSNNPTLTCIQVADVAAAANWATTKDATASFSLDCTIYTLIPDAKFEDKLIALGIDKDGKNGKVATENIASVTSLYISNSGITDLTGIQDFIALAQLSCYGNQLTSLDVSKNIALFYLDCRYHNLTNLDVSKNIALTTLACDFNQLATLDVSKNVALTFLSCNENKLTTLDVSKNVALTGFNCSSNKLLSLNLKNGKNTLLTNSNISLSSNPDLRCIAVDDVTYSNTNWANKKDSFAFYSPYNCSTITKIPDPKFEDKLIALGIDTDGKNGVVLNSSIAAITSLDVSNSSIDDLTGIQTFTALTTLNCSGNLLKKLDVSKNTAFSTLNCSNNPTLICIQVADVAAAVNWATTKDVTASFSLDCTIYTLIPDAKFEDKLIALGIDRDGKNGKVATESIASITSLELYNNSIADLTGIQDFKALTSLGCSSNKLTTLDVSKNIALTSLSCHSNQLKTLDVSKNVALTSLSCSSNQLITLDVSKNVTLTSLNCSSNQLTTLDVSKNVALTSLSCNSNQLTTLDVSKNIALNDLDCRINQLTTLDVAKNLALTFFHCYSNQLTSLDVSKNVALTAFYCSSNKLLSLNLKNGKNTLLTNIDLSSNPDLRCIAVDDVTYSNTNWATKKDSFAIFSPYDCSTVTPILDAKFEDKLIALGIDTDGKNGLVLNSSIAAITTLNVSNSAIADLTGIQGFTSLTTLNCSGNVLTKLDLSKNTAFSTLNCANNPTLTCIQVADIAATANWATTKDATASFNLDCTIYTLIPDAKFEDKLIALGIDRDGKNGKIAIESIASITYLDVSSSSIADLTGIQDFKALTLLECDSNKLANLDVSKNVALKNLFCRSNKLTSLDVSKNVALTYLFCEINLLTSLDVSKNLALTNLGCYSNQLSSLDVSKNKALTRFECSYNKLQTLNLKNGKNTLLTNSNISLSGNTNLYCILVDDITYSTTNWANRKDATATFNSVECKALSLPANNFSVESKGETCTDSKNGEISITGTATYSYKASVNGLYYSFTNNSLKLPNLAPGTYTVSITITGETFEQSFTVIIPKAATITGKSSVIANKVAVEITQGTAPYTVFVDGVEQFETNDSNFSVATKKGGVLEVKTAKACEGIYAAAIEGLEGAVTAYPNPTSGSFEVQLPTSKKEVVIALYTLNGQLISNKTYTVENGKAQLTLENQPAGVYIAKIEFDTPDYLKIIKN